MPGVTTGQVFTLEELETIWWALGCDDCYEPELRRKIDGYIAELRACLVPK